jgi:tetratricopeptide (TPR) repeat protein
MPRPGGHAEPCALERARSLADEDPKNDRFRRILALSYRKLADLESQQGELGQALQDARNAAEINRALAAVDPDNAQASANFALSLTMIASLLDKAGNGHAALDEYRHALAILEKLSTAAPTNLFMRSQLTEALVATGTLLAHQDRIAEARALSTRGIAIARELAGRPTATPDELSQYAQILLTCEPVELRDARSALKTAAQAVEKSQGRDPRSLRVLAQAYLKNGDTVRAAETEQRAQRLTAPHQN